MLFKPELLELVLQQRKTQTRRLSKQHLKAGRTYQLRANFKPGPPAGHITIKRRFEQRLGDVTEQDAHAEGFNNLADFQAFWRTLFGSFNPEQVVTAYEFELAEK
jgi:hypothetical protein